MTNYIENAKQLSVEIIEHFKNDLRSVHTGRVSPALLDHCMIEAYGVKTPLRELASISALDARTLAIQPWDKNIMKDIEKGIIEARVGGNPVVDGSTVRLSIPQLTEESRRELGKIVSGKLEEEKQSLRRVRDAIREQLVLDETKKNITEDDRYRAQKDLDTLTQDYQGRLVALADEKVTEIMTI